MSLLLPPPGGDARQVATAVNQALRGKINSSGTVVLAMNASSTTVINQFIGKDSIVLLMPQTQNAAADSMDNATYVDPTNYVEGVSFAITHANNAKPDRVFGYVVLGSGGAALDPNTVALLAQMTVQPSAGRIVIIDTAIRALRAAGLWGKMALFYVPAAHQEQAGRLNWVSPGTATLTAVNSPAFAPDRGFTGDGSSSYLDTGMAQSALSPYAQDAAHVGGWALTAGASSGKIIIGKKLNGGSTTAVRVSASTPGFNANVNGGAAVGASDGLTTGHVVGVRTSSSSVTSYRNGGTATTGASTSTALSSDTVTILQNNGNNFCDMQCALAHAGDQLSASDVATLYTIMQAYLHAIGAV